MKKHKNIMGLVLAAALSFSLMAAPAQAADTSSGQLAAIMAMGIMNLLFPARSVAWIVICS